MATTVTLTADAPANLADSLGLAATDRQAGDVLSLPHSDALALVQAGVAAFGSAAQDAAIATQNRARAEVRGYPVTPDAGAAVAAGGTLTGDTAALGDDHQWTTARLLVSSDQAGTAVVEQALDGAGPWLRPAAATTVAAGTPLIIEQPIAAPFLRAVITNGGTVAATVRAHLSTTP